MIVPTATGAATLAVAGKKVPGPVCPRNSAKPVSLKAYFNAFTTVPGVNMSESTIPPQSIPEDSPEGVVLGKVHTLATRIRGDFMGQAIAIDILIADILANYFTPNNERRMLLQSEVFSTSTFGKNINVLKAVVKHSFASFNKSNPEVLSDLDELRMFRNKLAHALLDLSDEWMAQGHTDRIRLLSFNKGKPVHSIITIEDSNKALGKASVILFGLVNLQKMVLGTAPVSGTGA
jgi:hypothetical protein